jgi:hypothetical protein
MIASPNFVIFFSKILQNENDLQKEVYPLLKKLTFGFWLKSQNLKNILDVNLLFIENSPEILREMVL